MCLVLLGCSSSEPAMVEVRLEILPLSNVGDYNLNLPFIELCTINEDGVKIFTQLESYRNAFQTFLTFQAAQGFSKTMSFGMENNKNIESIRLDISSGFIFDPLFSSIEIVEYDFTKLEQNIVIEDGFLYLIDIKLDISNLETTESGIVVMNPEFDIEMKKK